MTNQPKRYRARSAQDAQRTGYGTESYWDYLETSAYESHGYYRAKGDQATADRMFTRPLSEALMGNEGE